MHGHVDGYLKPWILIVPLADRGQTENRRGPRGKPWGSPASQQPSRGVGAAKGNPKSVERESRSMITSKTRKGKIQEKQRGLPGLNVSQESSDMQAEK